MESRRFCRFSRYFTNPKLAISEVPEGGFCLSVFLILRNSNNKEEVLLGKINPIEDWERIGALDKERAEKIKDGWMLPSSHLIYGEDPKDAAKRILKEQLGISSLAFDDPKVITYLYPSARNPQQMHWDIEFVFISDIDPSIIKPQKAWRELKFLNVKEVSKKDFSRDHFDILESLGYKLKD